MVKYYSLILALFLFGCSSASPSPTPVPTAQATLTPLPSPTAAPTSIPDYVTKIRNAEYQLGTTDTLHVVQLKDGKFEQGAPGGTDYISVNVTDFIAKSGNEYAALIAENYGGSGTFVFLAIYTDVNGAPKFLTSRIVDDRPQINALSFDGTNNISLDAVIHGSQDPMCCPALRTIRHYYLDKAGPLVMSDYSTFTLDNKAREIKIETPANNTETYSSVKFHGSVTVAPFENNLVYRIYDLAGVELASGSVPVSASQLGGSGTFDSVISLGNSLSGATVRIEIQDVSAADGSLLAMDSVELVVK